MKDIFIRILHAASGRKLCWHGIRNQSLIKRVDPKWSNIQPQARLPCRDIASGGDNIPWDRLEDITDSFKGAIVLRDQIKVGRKNTGQKAIPRRESFRWIDPNSLLIVQGVLEAVFDDKQAQCSSSPGCICSSQRKKKEGKINKASPSIIITSCKSLFGRPWGTKRQVPISVRKEFFPHVSAHPFACRQKSRRRNTNTHTHARTTEVGNKVSCFKINTLLHSYSITCIRDSPDAKVFGE